MKTHTVLIMGESRVGKSSIITRYCYGLFPYFYDPGWDRDSRSVTISGITHKIEIEDLSTYATPDQPYDLRDRVIATAEAYVLVYDITAVASLQNIRDIHAEVRRKGRPSRPVVIVGNKCDDIERREVTVENGRDLARELRAQFAEISARDGTGLDKLFQGLAIQINNSKKKDARFTANLNCRNLGKALLAALAKVSKGMEKLHWKILYCMYGPDRPLTAQPMVRPVLHDDREIYRVDSVQSATSGAQPGILLGGKPHSRGVRRRHVEYETEMMLGGLEITMAEPNRLDFSVRKY